jgi:tRNA (mo5U34)-methyltransferase
MRQPTRDEATRHAQRNDIVWFQRFELTPGVFTEGPSSIEFLDRMAGFPQHLEGKSVLDIGTCNGAVAFELERRGAARVVAVDIVDPDLYGFTATKELLGSNAEFLQASVYELPGLLDGERFDVVCLLGVLYHLRHPLLALDIVRELAREEVFIETAVCDAEFPKLVKHSVARFYRLDELRRGDGTNWFAPTTACLTDWCRSAGLEVERLRSWPDDAPTRAMVSARVTEGAPEYLRISYERPLKVTTAAPAAT